MILSLSLNIHTAWHPPWVVWLVWARSARISWSKLFRINKPVTSQDHTTSPGVRAPPGVITWVQLILLNHVLFFYIIVWYVITIIFIFVCIDVCDDYTMDLYYESLIPFNYYSVLKTSCFITNTGNISSRFICMSRIFAWEMQENIHKLFELVEMICCKSWPLVCPSNHRIIHLIYGCYTYIHTHTHTYMYIYIYIYVCVCV